MDEVLLCSHLAQLFIYFFQLVFFSPFIFPFLIYLSFIIFFFSRGNCPPTTSETTSSTGSDTDDDPVYDPNSDTDLTEPDRPLPGPRMASAKGNKDRETPTKERRTRYLQAKAVESPTEGPNRKSWNVLSAYTVCRMPVPY